MPNTENCLVCGPQGCGKTTHARLLAEYLGLRVILDNWRPGLAVPASGALILTNSPDRTAYPVPAERVFDFADVMRRVRVGGA